MSFSEWWCKFSWGKILSKNDLFYTSHCNPGKLTDFGSYFDNIIVIYHCKITPVAGCWFDRIEITALNVSVFEVDVSKRGRSGKKKERGMDEKWNGVMSLIFIGHISYAIKNWRYIPFFPTVPTFAVRETASLGIMGEPRVPPLNPSESIVLW